MKWNVVSCNYVKFLFGNHLASSNTSVIISSSSDLNFLRAYLLCLCQRFCILVPFFFSSLFCPLFRLSYIFFRSHLLYLSLLLYYFFFIPFSFSLSLSSPHLIRSSLFSLLSLSFFRLFPLCLIYSLSLSLYSLLSLFDLFSLCLIYSLSSLFFHS